MLLRPEHLDPQIQAELNTEPLDAKICPIDAMELNLINKLLQANYTAVSLQEYREKVKDITSPWSLKNGLLKYWERLVVAEEQDLRTWLILKHILRSLRPTPEKLRPVRL